MILKSAAVRWKRRRGSGDCRHRNLSRVGGESALPLTAPTEAPLPMQTTLLLEKLLEIERSIGHVDNLTIRAMLIDAQTQLVNLEEDVIAMLVEMRELREGTERAAPARVVPKWNPARNLHERLVARGREGRAFAF